MIIVLDNNDHGTWLSCLIIIIILIIVRRPFAALQTTSLQRLSTINHMARVLTGGLSLIPIWIVTVILIVTMMSPNHHDVTNRINFKLILYIGVVTRWMIPATDNGTTLHSLMFLQACHVDVIFLKEQQHLFSLNEHFPYHQHPLRWAYGVLLYEMLVGQPPFDGIKQPSSFPSTPTWTSVQISKYLSRQLEDISSCMSFNLLSQYFRRGWRGIVCSDHRPYGKIHQSYRTVYLNKSPNVRWNPTRFNCSDNLIIVLIKNIWISGLLPEVHK